MREYAESPNDQQTMTQVFADDPIAGGEPHLTA